MLRPLEGEGVAKRSLGVGVTCALSQNVHGAVTVGRHTATLTVRDPAFSGIGPLPNGVSPTHASVPSSCLAMTDVVTLSARDVERLMHVIHGSLDVRRKSQFFLWVQGRLQSLIPHEVMICSYGDYSRRSLVVEHFASYPLPGQDVESINDPENGLMIQAVRAWAERGEKPLLLCNSDRNATVYRRFESALFKHAFPNIAIHGMPVMSGHPSTHFIFANLPQPLTGKLGYILELLIPYVHAAFVRMLANERLEQYAPPPTDRLITAREIEILQWVRDGKSNLEIGHILDISPLTVKNHVQKILKKLNVQNRAQAVARGISLQVIKSGPI